MQSRSTQARKGSQSEVATALLKDRGMMRLREFTAAGVNEETISRLARRGTITRLSRGLYQLAGAKPDASHSLAEAAKIVPKGTICLLSALQFHGLTTQLPSEVWMAIGRTAWKTSRETPPIRFVRFGGPALEIGVEVHRIEGVPVRIFGVAKTVVDCFRYRNKIGTDIAIEALRDALARRLCKPAEISSIANRLRALNVIRPYLETVAADGA